MRSFIAYILLASILLPTFSSWGTIAYFQLNRSYIAKVLCENRDRPQLKCNGKCFLAKKLKQQQEKKDKETSTRVENIPSIQLFSVPPFYFSFRSEIIVVPSRSTFCYLTSVYQSEFARLLRPPQV